MRIAINTSCAVAGGAITHLRHVLPEMLRLAGSDEIVVIGDSKVRDRIAPPPNVQWVEVASPRWGLLGRLWFENFRLPALLVQLRADVLFHPANFAAFRAPIPQVILIHNLAPFLSAVVEGESIVQRIRLRLLRTLTLISLRVARTTIFISRWGRALVVSNRVAGDREMPVIPFGAEHGTAKSDPRVLSRWGLAKDEFVLTVSHLYRYKKLEKLIEAFDQLGSRVRDMSLVIVGEPYDAGYAERMKGLASRSSARIVFTGGLDADSLAALMVDCRLFVFTSEAENLPITLLEAMAAGSAIVTNRTCSMPEVCGDAVLYAEPASASVYAEQILRLISNEQERLAYRAAATRQASHFDWLETATRTLAVLREAEEATK